MDLVMVKPNEQKLLDALADADPGEPWAALVSHHHRRVFALASHILRGQGSAEDVTQETFLTVWQNRNALPAAECFERWLLRIAANEALMAIRGFRRWEARKARALDKQTLLRSDPESRPSSRPPHLDPDAQAALKVALAELPDDLRLPVVLHFLAGYSMKEIAFTCKCHPKTVRRRMDEALGNMRTAFIQAGYAGTWLGADSLGPLLDVTLDPGPSLPPALCDRLLALPSHPARVSAPKGFGVRSGNLPVGWLARLSLAALFVVLAAILVNGAPWRVSNAPAIGAIPSGPSPDLSGAVHERTLISNFPHVWDFNTPGQEKDFKVVQGSWHYVPSGGPDGSGCMQIDTAVFIAEFTFPIHHQLPFRITARVLTLPQGRNEYPHYRFSVFWSSEYMASFYNALPEYPIRLREWVDFRINLSGGWEEHGLLDHPWCINFYELTETSRLFLQCEGSSRIDDLAVRALPFTERPNFDKYRNALQGIPRERRFGKVVMPDLKSGRPPEPVYIQFVSPPQAPGGAPGQD